MASGVTLRALFSEHPDAICKALREIARTLGPDAVHDRRPEDWTQRRDALADQGCEARLLALAAGDDAVLRELAADALGAYASDAARAALVRLCQDPITEVRASAAGALAHWHDDAEVAEVLCIAIDDSRWLVRMQAARAMRHLRGPAIESALLTALLDPDSYVRSTAADSLACHPSASVLPRLRALFDHPAPYTFDAAFELIGRLGDAGDAAFLARVGRLTNLSQPAQVKTWARAAARAITARSKTGG